MITAMGVYQFFLPRPVLLAFYNHFFLTGQKYIHQTVAQPKDKTNI